MYALTRKCSDRGFELICSGFNLGARRGIFDAQHEMTNRLQRRASLVNRQFKMLEFIPCINCGGSQERERQLRVDTKEIYQGVLCPISEGILRHGWRTSKSLNRER